MTPETASALRQPFPKEAIGKLPKGGTQLDYVGHAAVTDRLLQVDPEWSWEPVAFDGDGLPLVAQQGSDSVLWIRLTVCGMTRLGVGTCPTKSFELHKQLVSDALRNAAMRFGVALDLWSREELHPPGDDPKGGQRQSVKSAGTSKDYRPDEDPILGELAEPTATHRQVNAFKKLEPAVRDYVKVKAAELGHRIETAADLKALPRKDATALLQLAERYGAETSTVEDPDSEEANQPKVVERPVGDRGDMAGEGRLDRDAPSPVTTGGQA